MALGILAFEVIQSNWISELSFAVAKPCEWPSLSKSFQLKAESNAVKL